MQISSVNSTNAFNIYSMLIQFVNANTHTFGDKRLNSLINWSEVVTISSAVLHIRRLILQCRCRRVHSKEGSGVNALPNLHTSIMNTWLTNPLSRLNHISFHITILRLKLYYIRAAKLWNCFANISPFPAASSLF